MEFLYLNLAIYNDSNISFILTFLMELITINNLIGIFLFSGFILLSGKAGKILDTASKITGIAAGTTILYKHWVEGGSSGSGSDDNKDNKKEDKNNDNKDNKDKNKTNDKTNNENNESNKKN